MENMESIFGVLLKALDTPEPPLEQSFAAGCANAQSSQSTSLGVQGRRVHIPVGVSNRHIHLCQNDVDALFGQGYQLNKMKDLSQPGQFSCKETVTICGPKGAIEKVRILGPVRSKTQVEILAGDSFKLGVIAPARLSGDLQGTPGVTLIGSSGSVQLEEGLIVAQRHIHMNRADAMHLGVTDKQIVSVKQGGQRGGILSNVMVRADDNSALEFHIDIEEANAMNINAKSEITIIK